MSSLNPTPGTRNLMLPGNVITRGIAGLPPVPELGEIVIGELSSSASEVLVEALELRPAVDLALAPMPLSDVEVGFEAAANLEHDVTLGDDLTVQLMQAEAFDPVG